MKAKNTYTGLTEKFFRHGYSKEIVGGYYLLKAESLSAAVEIANGDPRFQDDPWKIEIRPKNVVEGINQ